MPTKGVDAGQSISRRRGGFTMMEMVAVIAVIAILATLAVPSYLERIVRDQIRESLPLADVAKKPVADAWAATQTFPADNAAAGLPVPDKIVANYVTSVTVRDGAIHITFGNRASGAISGNVLSLRPAVVADAPIVPVAWVCGSAEAPSKMTVNGSTLRSIKDGLLPLECRALKR
ncbi:MAG TPA: pilin [Casimicrobiaceae bacterium]|nr:pilin [Casimicrobiaceae bacterium]